MMGFCRTAAGIWCIGAGLFHLHRTSYFDDFFLVCEEGEERHIDLAQRLLPTPWVGDVRREGG